MNFMLFSTALAVAFFGGSLILLNWGRHLGVRYLKREGASSMAGLSTIEGAVFGLMGLLLAFTISGALQRFDERRQLVIQEATAVSTAYDRLGLLEGDAANDLRTRLKSYVGARVDLYRMPHDFSPRKNEEVFSDDQQHRLLELKAKAWDAAVAACPKPRFQPACPLALTALSNVFEVARLRAGAAEKHPPRIIYFLLFGLGLGCSMLAGFGMAAAGSRSLLHTVTFAGVLATALYIVTDMEYPRLGLIRIENFDHFLADAYDQMR
jgi:hypothetical protein